MTIEQNRKTVLAAAQCINDKNLAGFTEFSFEAQHVTAEGDRVCMEATSSGVGPGAAKYQNIYNFIFEMKDGKIYTAREFLDPFEVLAYIEHLPAA